MRGMQSRKRKSNKKQNGKLKEILLKNFTEVNLKFFLFIICMIQIFSLKSWHSKVEDQTEYLFILILNFRVPKTLMHEWVFINTTCRSIRIIKIIKSISDFTKLLSKGVDSMRMVVLKKLVSSNLHL